TCFFAFGQVPISCGFPDRDFADPFSMGRKAESGRVDPDGGAGERHGALGRWRAKVSFDRTAMLAKCPRAPPSRWRRWRAALGAVAFRFCAVSFSRRR